MYNSCQCGRYRRLPCSSVFGQLFGLCSGLRSLVVLLAVQVNALVPSNNATCVQGQPVTLVLLHTQSLNDQRLARLPSDLSGRLPLDLTTDMSSPLKSRRHRHPPPQPRNTRPFWLGSTSRTPTNDTVTLTSHHPSCKRSSGHCGLYHPVCQFITHPNY